LGIFSESLVKEVLAAFQPLKRKAVPVIAPFEVSVVSNQALGLAFYQGLVGVGQLHAKSIYNGSRNVVLNGKDIGHLAVAAFRPELTPISHVDQLRVNSEPGTCCAHAAFEHGSNLQLFGNLTKVLTGRTKLKRRRSRRDAKAGNSRQSIDDLLGQAIGEILTFLVRV